MSPANSRKTKTPETEPAFLVFDIETVPDGELLRRVRYAKQSISPEEAVRRARAEALERSEGRSDFIPASFCVPVAVSVARITANFELEAITVLDAPKFRPREIVAAFWKGLARHKAVLVSFNGRGFDLPVLEWAAFRYGIAAKHHFSDRFGRRYRFGATHLDLQDWLTNHGACVLAGGLDLLSKLLGKPGKMSISGRDVYDLHREGKVREINDYCMFDVLDTYFVFLRTRVLTGEVDLAREQELVGVARAWIESQLDVYPHFKSYLKNWGDWKPWL